MADTFIKLPPDSGASFEQATATDALGRHLPKASLHLNNAGVPVEVSKTNPIPTIPANALGIGIMQVAPVGSANGSPITTVQAAPAGSTVVRIYVPTSSTLTYTVAATQPVSPPLASIVLGTGIYDEPLAGTNMIYITAVTGTASKFRWL